MLQRSSLQIKASPSSALLDVAIVNICCTGKGCLISIDHKESSPHSKSDKVCGLCFSVSKNLRKKCVNCDKEFGVNGAFFENILCFNVFIEKLSND